MSSELYRGSCFTNILILALNLYALAQCYKSAFPEGTNDMKKNDAHSLVKNGLKWVKIWVIVLLVLNFFLTIHLWWMPDSGSLFTDSSIAGAGDFKYKRFVSCFSFTDSFQGGKRRDA